MSAMDDRTTQRQVDLFNVLRRYLTTPVRIPRFRSTAERDLRILLNLLPPEQQAEAQARADAAGRARAKQRELSGGRPPAKKKKPVKKAKKARDDVPATVDAEERVRRLRAAQADAKRRASDEAKRNARRARDLRAAAADKKRISIERAESNHRRARAEAVSRLIAGRRAGPVFLSNLRLHERTSRRPVSPGTGRLRPAMPPDGNAIQGRVLMCR